MKIFTRGKLWGAIVLVLLAVPLCWFVLKCSNSDALRRIVFDQCIPAKRLGKQSSPCADVNLSQGYVVMKDRNGPLQYLLMPTMRINGMESPLLLNAQTPNYFWLAWQSRIFMQQPHNHVVPDSAVLLAINSRVGRTQNHLHIHISCIRPDVRVAINRIAAVIKDGWIPLGGGFNGHKYLLKRIDANTLLQRSPFRILAQEVPEADKHMGRYALAMAQLPDGDFMLMATERNVLQLNLASSEELQDHDCAVLNAMADKVMK